MQNISQTAPSKVVESYAVLRHGGAPPSRAAAELSLARTEAEGLEARFLTRRASAGADSMRPRFARHDAHTAAVTAAGGFPVMRP